MSRAHERRVEPYLPAAASISLANGVAAPGPDDAAVPPVAAVPSA